MNVKHGGQGHVHIVGTKPPDGLIGPGGDADGQGVKHKLAVGEMDALGVAGGVKGGGPRVFIEVRKIVGRKRLCQHVFIHAVEFGCGLRRGAVL